LNEVIPLWASLLVVMGVLLLGAVVLGLLAKRSASKLSKPLPSAAIQEAQRTMKAIEDHV
jgi:hypothetical protein